MNNGKVTNDWLTANKRYLMASVAVVRVSLQRYAAVGQGQPEPEDFVVSQLQLAKEEAARDLASPSALNHICNTFNLTPFECDVLLLCAGMELDHTFPQLCAEASNDPQRPFPTFGLALRALNKSHWSAITPKATLRRWRLIEVGVGPALTLSSLRIDERILHYLAGVEHLDERLWGVVEPLSVKGTLVDSHQLLAQQLAEMLSQSSGSAIVQLCGSQIASKRAIARHACKLLGLKLHVMSAQVIPTTAKEIDVLMQLWKRESALAASALLLDCDEIDANDTARENAIARLIEGIQSHLIVSSYNRVRSRQRSLITLDVNSPTTSEQYAIWEEALGDKATNTNGYVEALVSQFSLSTSTIHAACAEALGKEGAEEQESRGESQFSTLLWETCRVHSRPHMDDLAQRIDSSPAWDDLVLPETQRQILRDISAHVRQRSKVYETWGFAGKGGRGLGISALFAGSSGTGKTMAAEVLAAELRLDLYRIDLSSVVSKYIGETEKNLRRVFDAAEVGGAILLFDEADALFGKRSEVKDSHDRYANMEVSYLLQRMEAYRGLAILTTNLKDSLDTAFMRRIRFLIKFPFPDVTQRAEIWRRVFPKNTPTEKLDANKLAKLNVAGGNIRNIALNAAFLAADAGEAVSMKHLLTAARSEYAKLERTLTDAEIKGWI